MARTHHTRTTARQRVAFLLTTLLAQVICLLTPTVALAETHMDVFYQFFRTNPTYIEDYLRLDVPAIIDEDTIHAQVNPYIGDFRLRETDIAWRVMVNFAGGTPADEHDITDEATYDEETGMLTLPATHANEHLSFVAQLPWMHPAHDLVTHWQRDAVATRARAARALVAQTSVADIAVGSLYYVKNVTSGPNGSSSPLMLGKDYDTHNLATLCGYPELESHYAFFVAFQKDNCALFELCDAVPGRPGASGNVTTDYGDVIPRDLTGHRWVTADCVEDVNNGREIFYVIEDAGSWVRVDAIDGDTLHCTFRLSVNGPGGANYQDVMGKFDLRLPYGSIRLTKRSALPSMTDGNASYRLDGAAYGVYGDAACTQVVGTLTTDRNGTATLRNVPAGRYWVTETAAPEGYTIDTTVYVVTVHPGMTTDVGDGTVRDMPRYTTGNLTVQKADAEGTITAQGDATLAGARLAVAYYDGTYDDTGSLPETPTRTWTVTTADLGDGIVGARLGDPSCNTGGDALYEVDERCVLPLGTIAVRELTAPTGYLLTDATTHLLHVVSDEGVPGGARLQKVGDWGLHYQPIDELNLAINDQVARGAVRLGKVDAEMGRHHAQGGATLAGTVMAIELTSAQPVVVDGVTYERGEVVATVTLGADGTGHTDAGALPYGSYVAYELTAPKGYLLADRDAWSRAFSIRADGDLVDLASMSDSIANQVIRGDLDLTKVSERTMGRLGGVPIVIASDTTGEAHVIVTDENGYASTAASWTAHTNATNANDDAVTRNADGTWSVVDEGALSSRAGVWFSGDSEVTTDANNALGALPYDTYTLTELRSNTNAGLALVSFTVTVSRHGVTVACGTIADRPDATIATTLTDVTTGTHVASAGTSVTLRDTVRYTSLEPGTYELVGELHAIAENGSDAGVLSDAAGEPISATTSFVADGADGTTSVTFALDASMLAGRSVVAFETLLAGDTVIATHADVADTAQTVSFATIETQLSDADTGSKVVASDGHVTVVDAVSYQGLEPGIAYHLAGTLVDQTTGKPALTAAADPITGATTFVPKTGDGTVDVRFDYDARDQAGRTLVACQTLTVGDVELVVHDNLNNDAQTIVSPAIATTATCADTGRHEASIATTQIVDTVSYENLEMDGAYELRAVVVRAGTGETVLGSVDEPAARMGFLAEGSSGTVDVEIPVDARELAGSTVVVYEYLYQGEHRIASHVDASDSAQSIAFPGLATEAIDVVTGTHELVADVHAGIVDTLSYHNLTPGHTYVVAGTLHGRDHDGNDTGVLDDGSGHASASTLTFVPESESGSVRLSFDVDASRLAGTSVVAFEQIIRQDDDTVVAEHADIASTSQAVSVVRRPTDGTPLPRTGDDAPDVLPALLVGTSALLTGLLAALLGRREGGTSRRRRRRGRPPIPLP